LELADQQTAVIRRLTQSHLQVAVDRASVLVGRLWVKTAVLVAVAPEQLLALLWEQVQAFPVKVMPEVLVVLRLRVLLTAVAVAVAVRVLLALRLQPTEEATAARALHQASPVRLQTMRAAGVAVRFSLAPRSVRGVLAAAVVVLTSVRALWQAQPILAVVAAGAQAMWQAERAALAWLFCATPTHSLRQLLLAR
jgi:hypothetical protein